MQWETFAVPLEWDEAPPPALAPVPAAHMPALVEGDEVTIGTPDGLWLPDQIVSSPRVEPRQWRGETLPCVQVAPPWSWWAHQSWPQREWHCQWWPLAHTWVYRDVVTPVGSSSPPPAPGWVERAQEAPRDRPPTRWAIPAREVGRLTGHRVRVRLADGSLGWHVAASEPFDDGHGEILVKIATASTWGITGLVLAEIDPEHLSSVEIFRVWVQ